MCDPASIAVASLVATGVGAGVSAYGQIQQGKAAKAQANYQAQVARNNAIIAERQAKDAEARGKVAETGYRQQVSQLMGRQRAVLASNGVVVDEGSALDVLGDTAEIGEFDALTIRANAEREAYGYRAQGSNFEAEAGLATARGRSAQQAGFLGAGSTLLSGAGSVADKWSAWKNETRSRS